MKKTRPPKQLSLLSKQSLSYGGELMKTRAGRRGGRPLVTRGTMHLVLRSSQAKGQWSFRTPANQRKIKVLVQKFCKRYHVTLLSFANVGNHLHFHIQLFKRADYRRFIRALTSALMMAVTGINRWSKAKSPEPPNAPKAHETSPRRWKFWDYRPFTRVVQSYRAFLNLRDYIEINQWEGAGLRRESAREFVRRGIWVVEETG